MCALLNQNKYINKNTVGMIEQIYNNYGFPYLSV